MRGRWTFEAVTEGTRVVAERDFELSPNGPLDPSVVASSLGRILEHNLDLFSEAVEADGAD
jgi:hypothetical protein